jgi:hypothetical protein
MHGNSTTLNSSQAATPSSTLPLSLSPRRRLILPGDRVLIFDTGRFRWHQVADVIIGERTKIRVQGTTWFFDEGIVARHEGRSC